MLKVLTEFYCLAWIVGVCACVCVCVSACVLGFTINYLRLVNPGNVGFLLDLRLKVHQPLYVSYGVAGP